MRALFTVTGEGRTADQRRRWALLHGRWHFGTARDAARARQLAARPSASRTCAATTVRVPDLDKLTGLGIDQAGAGEEVAERVAEKLADPDEVAR